MALFRIAAAAGLLLAVAPEPTLGVLRSVFGIADAVPLSQNAAAEAALAYCREHPRTCVDIARKAEGIPSTLAKGAKP
ncbi:MAG: hypothetical protein IOC90_10705 [Methylocystis sp.]|jgi:hypothetical protein|nr:hypothetical protein [Methylocystis sp.]MCA3582771.1 hypothetical protein [Methylocystis sp.]MCA3588487.1 hypothetical protein [Methylocystis sp.]MCA3592068.1 hypothetical protein [Methylocystis sp.]